MSCVMCSRWEDDADLQIWEGKYSRLVLNRDQYFRGYCLLFTREHVTELFHLEPEVRQGVMEEMVRVAAALAELFQPAKMNYELLGNMVPHIHWHLVPRFTDDPLWPRPIWSEAHAELHLSSNENAARIKAIRKALGAG
ncbi:MAG: HIT family protein [Desulfuromonas sp.]|nr:MAG: HIT family protein [Desulfuromonas sp.]